MLRDLVFVLSNTFHCSADPVLTCCHELRSAQLKYCGMWGPKHRHSEVNCSKQKQAVYLGWWSEYKTKEVHKIQHRKIGKLMLTETTLGKDSRNRDTEATWEESDWHSNNGQTETWDNIKGGLENDRQGTLPDHTEKRLRWTEQGGTN